MKLARSLAKVIPLFLLTGLLVIGIPHAINRVRGLQAIAQTPPSALQLVQQARTLYNSDRFPEAAPLLQQAVAVFEAEGDVLNQAMASSNLAATLAQLAQWQQAEQAINSSLSMLRSQPDSSEQLRILAQTRDIQGQLMMERGRFQDALDAWTLSKQLYQKLEAKNQLIQIQISQSLALQALGLYPRACQTLLVALNIETPTCELSPEVRETLKNQPDSLENLRTLNALGHVLRVLGQLPESQQVLSVGLKAAQTLGTPQEQAVLYLNVGNTARALANQPTLTTQQRAKFDKSALESYAKAAQLSSQGDTQSQAQLNQLSLLVEGKHWSEAEAMWRSLQPKVNQLSSNRAGLFSQINLAGSLMQLAAHSSDTAVSFSEIDQILNRANQQAYHLGDARIQAYILGNQGKLYELQQERSRAETVTTQALSIAPPFEFPDIAYQLLWQLGRIQQGQGKTEEAIAQYTQAVNILASLRGDLVSVNPEVQFSFRESVEPIYRELVGLLLKEKSPSQTKLKQARQTIESLQLAELDNFFRDACADAKSKSIDDFDSTAAIIYPIILSDRLEVILSIPGKPLLHYTTQKSRSELETTFKKMRNSLRASAFIKEQIPLAQQLYDWLLRPIEQNLTDSGIKTLVFVLDGYLRNLPLAALHDGEKYLIQKYNIALTPGLQLLEPRPLTQVKLKVLTGGLTEARQGFSALPAVANELQQISAEISSNTLLNQQFIAQELQAKIKAVSFPIVHLATHGQFSSNAAETFIVTWDKRVNVKEFDRLLRSRSEEKKPPIEMLVLSACETASGDDRAALGLAGVAIRSGARSTLGTLWQVNDQSTAIFMAEFYRQLAQSKISKAEALRNAQLMVLQNPQYQNPYFWAPFVLVGNWQ